MEFREVVINLWDFDQRLSADCRRPSCARHSARNYQISSLLLLALLMSGQLLVAQESYQSLALPDLANVENNDDMAYLSGSWKKAVGRYLLPVGPLPDDGTWIDVSIPESWPEHGGSNLQAATYVLDVNFPSPQSGLYLNIGQVYSTFELYVSNFEGELVLIASNGDPMTTSEEGSVIMHPVALPDLATTTRFVFRLNASEYPGTRLLGPLLIGGGDAIEDDNWRKRALVAFFMGSFLVIAIYNSFLWLSGPTRHWEYFIICFSAVNLFIRLSAQHDIVNLWLWHTFALETAAGLGIRIGWATLGVAFGTLAGLLRTLFPLDVSRLVASCIAVPWLLFAVIALTTAPKTYIPLGEVYLLTIPGLLLLYLGITVFVLWKRRAGSLTLIIGAILIAGCAYLDLVRYNNHVTQVIETVNVAFLVFFIMQSLQLARKYAESLEQSAELAIELKEVNENLENQVKDRTQSLELANISLKQLAMSDPLTGLPNRRAFQIEFDRELLRVDRYQHEFALAIMDLDYFKKVNDTWGHDYGDDVLVAVANELTTGTRETDTIARFGGEEFVVLLPETTRKPGEELFERMRTQIESMVVQSGDAAVKVTASFGMTVCAEGEYPADVLKRADQALYMAKQQGRNRVVYKGLARGYH